ncbi:NAD-glutamate dehydrogenase [Defluviicoccus vanus]|uniref:NAD-glutamate dehydrogenase n=1 Tax=Defluviicoccus vanus TaxID=111831 RepID=UPI001CBA64AE|nr:NAD-glutamate dehydrogenase [Defluviicoccus vanus]
MNRIADFQRDELLDHIAETAARRLGEDAARSLVPFFATFYAHVPLDELRGSASDTLVAAALAHWRLAQQRPSGLARIRVYNPSLEVDGWTSEHTVVEVVTDDMPFLLASVTAELRRQGLDVLLVIHPVVRVRRTEAGDLLELAGENDAQAIAESFIHVEVGRQATTRLAAIADGVATVLADVKDAVTDLQPARQRLQAIIDTLPTSLPGQSADDVAEVHAFLTWLYKTHFTFLGYTVYVVERQGDVDMVVVEPGSGLGVLRDPATVVFDDIRPGQPVPPAARVFLERPELLAVSKASRHSTVHRPTHMDTIVIKRLDGGKVTGVHLIVGLFGSAAYTVSAREVPLLRRKIEHVLDLAGFAPRSHDARALINILETFPRDELFQVTEDYLLRVALGVLHLQQRPRVALFVRRDDFDRFVSCLVYVPRDRFTTELRLTIQAILERAFAGTVTAHFNQVTDAPLARLQVYLRTSPDDVPEHDIGDVEAEIVAACRSWADQLLQALTVGRGEEEGRRLLGRYADAFPPSYRERFTAGHAVADISEIEGVLAGGRLRITLYRPLTADDHQMRFKLFHPEEPIPLSQVLPVLENLGLKVIDEVPHRVMLHADGSPNVIIHDFGVESESGRTINLEVFRSRFIEAFAAVWYGLAESDRLNALILDADLSWRDAVVLRTYARYLRQAGMPFSQRYIEHAVVSNAGLAGLIVELFRTLFDPARSDRDSQAEAKRTRIGLLLDQVVSADDDRILRRFLNLVEATLRTNYFQPAEGGDVKPYLAIKLDSAKVEDLPLPRPMVEIFVYSPRMEGIHLRGGRVARGGIRWSDRREDFRSEVLGLMKAQMVKNAVIVPVGAKGGFVVKQAPDPADREATLAAGIAAYRTLIAGLLDLTDNLVEQGIRAPENVVRRDSDDPYLVVAADKGTATFSDIANGISAEYGFWLGDAFASGGSQGYDHKKMGITARGAWEGVKRHFRELGRDVQTEPFTVVGVGDMSGDVFGNGMLLSPMIRLVAAFDHRHVFVDPEPDPATSFTERARLFALPRSSWADYDASLLSPGGRVFDRKAKTITLTPEIRARFGLTRDRLTPAELVNWLLRAEVDLLWFGGIGTFIKAADESHAQVGDRANDAVRVDADKLRCKVVGEGANLGITQRARIAFAARGGRINTDFIDNSAGVDCSDHEVNIKILTDAVVADGDLTIKQRNALLSEMTDDVGAHVLRDNYLQTQAISLIEAEGAAALENQIRLIRFLERHARLNRAVEFLPNDDVLAERAVARQGLTRPEIAILFSYCKIWLNDELLRSNLPDDPHLAEDLTRYFPPALEARFASRIGRHRLRSELIATTITNSLINRVGGTFLIDMAEKTGATPADLARAYIIVRDVFALRGLWEEIEALDGRVSAAVQMAMHRDLQRLIERATLWILRNGGVPLDISVNIAAFNTAIPALAVALDQALPESLRQGIEVQASERVAQGVPPQLARRLAVLSVMSAAGDVVRLAAARGESLEAVVVLYFAVGETFGFGWLREEAERIVASGYWQRLAIAAAVEELTQHQRALVERIMVQTGRTDTVAIDQWCDLHRNATDRARVLIGEMQTASGVDLSMISVAIRQLRTLTQS